MDWKTSTQRIPAPSDTVSLESSAGMGGIWPSSSHRNVTWTGSLPPRPALTDSSMSAA